MMKRSAAVLFVCACVAAAQFGPAAQAAELKKWRVISEKTVTGFAFPESVAYDPKARVLYVSEFGGTKLAPAEKDGQGRISKVSLDGKVLEQRFLPAEGATLNKPKGIWVRGNRLWVTDIDSVWIFDLKTRKGRKLEIPGITFANDPAIVGNSLYVSDNRADRLYRIEPPDFLDANVKPQISIPLAGKSISPNGVYPGRNRSLLVVGFASPKEPRGIWSLSHEGELKELAKAIGRLDGVYQMNDGGILATDWNSGSLFRWSEKGGWSRSRRASRGLPISRSRPRATASPSSFPISRRARCGSCGSAGDRHGCLRPLASRRSPGA